MRPIRGKKSSLGYHLGAAGCITRNAPGYYVIRPVNIGVYGTHSRDVFTSLVPCCGSVCCLVWDGPGCGSMVGVFSLLCPFLTVEVVNFPRLE